MKVFLQIVLMAVAMLVGIFSAAIGVTLAMSPNTVDKSGNILIAFLVTGLALSVLMLVVSYMKNDQLIKRVVGIMPGQINDWKWQIFAKTKVEDRLRLLARRIEVLNREERDFLSKVSATPDKILEMHKEIKEALREFREIHDAFVGRDLELKDSWRHYVS